MIKEKEIFKNILWLIGDRFLILLMQFFVGVKVANYYGAKIYGEYNYAVAIVAFSPIILEILNRRVIKSYYTDNYNNIISIVTTFRNILSGIILIGTIGMYPFIGKERLLYQLLVLLTFDSFLATFTMGIEDFFEYKLVSRNVVIANNIVKVISYGLQYIGLILGLSILMVPIVRIIGNFIRILIINNLYMRYYKNKIRIILNFNILKKIIKESYYLWVSFIGYLIYTQMDKIMIEKMLGISQVGIYSIAIQLMGVLNILVGPFQNSIYSKMIELYGKSEQDYYKFYLKSNTLITWIYILLTFLSIIVVIKVFPYVYSKEYYAAIGCYIILSISILFKANGCLQTAHITLTKTTKYLKNKIYLGLFFNLILNYFFIRKYGIYGAALATTITEIITIFIIDFFINAYRKHFFIQLKSINIFNLLKNND